MKSSVVNETTSLAKIMELEVDNNNIDKLLEEHSQELTTEDLMALHCVSQQESCGGEFGREGGSNSKAKLFWYDKRKFESMENCCIVH
ncbi:hypothetical protein AVEN_245811-1 [Araneus ventricosus]|uniref:Uncharacterized protein n=1 Tax=Araneus ventricosus TaxID=182803 RepID=A0A4Y2EAS9_ARAVE|nr:hypothetical protein AVEN_245811-1 [Araneus ventricosus]